METKEAIIETLAELNNEESTESSAESKEIKDEISAQERSDIFIDIKDESEMRGRDSTLGDEVALLLNLKEKTLVLFEGLRSAQKDELKTKLEMVISYLEYQLYTIEERLNALQKYESGVARKA